MNKLSNVSSLAYAKLNLTLEILGRRDDGYHEIKTVMQTINLADRLEFSPSTRLQVECDDQSLAGKANLVWKAAQDLADSAGISPRARITIEKHIPNSMGLGGGSSDAACALVSLNQLWDLNLSLERLSEIAAGIGSDVSFFLSGGTALAEGRGEQVSLLPPLPSTPVILVCPYINLPNKTAAMYSKLTAANFSDGGITRRMIQILAGGHYVRDSVGGLIQNAFEEVASLAFPDLSSVRQELEQLAPGKFHLSGAGPALFALPASESDSRVVADALQPYNAGVYLVHTVSPRTAASIV